MVGIEKESLVPLDSISLSSTEFFDDLHALDRLLKEDAAAYIILRRYQNAPDGFVAVTYVPDRANVRQKMLFASTRLTLVRELGAERFRETLFATTKEELTAEGWRKHDKHGELKAPLTEEEQTLQGVNEAEAEASMGTTSRSSHVSGSLSFPISDGARQALVALPSGNDNLVQLVYHALHLPESDLTECRGSTRPKKPWSWWILPLRTWKNWHRSSPTVSQDTRSSDTHTRTKERRCRRYFSYTPVPPAPKSKSA